MSLLFKDKNIESVWYGPSPEEAPTLIFLHEGLGCVSMWRDFPEKLSRKTECGALVFSRLGYGGSDSFPLPRELDFLHHEAFIELPKILTEYKIQEYILIGHSDGASIALIFGGMSSKCGLLGIVCEAPHVFCENITIFSIKKIKNLYYNGNLRERLKKHHGKNVDNAFNGWVDVWLDPNFTSWNIESYLPKIYVPQLIIQGLNDEYGTSQQVEAIKNQSGNSVETCFLKNCGHTPHIDQEKKTIKAMDLFIRKLIVKKNTKYLSF